MRLWPGSSPWCQQDESQVGVGALAATAEASQLLDVVFPEAGSDIPRRFLSDDLRRSHTHHVPGDGDESRRQQFVGPGLSELTQNKYEPSSVSSYTMEETVCPSYPILMVGRKVLHMRSSHPIRSDGGCERR